jgi:von Willebrand factor type D domain
MRPRLALILLVVLLLAGGAFWYLRHPHSAAPSNAPATAATTAAEASSQAKLLGEIIAKGVTPDRAKQYFSLAVKVLPGVSIDGMTHDPTDFDGTAAVYYLRQVWPSLAPDQKKVAHDVMVGTGARAMQRGSNAIGQPRVLLAGFGMAADDPAHDYENLEKNANNAIAQAMGVSAVPIRTVVVMDTASEFAHSQSWPDNSDQPFEDGKCWTIVHNTKFLALDDLSTASIMAHEAMHCYQDRAAGTGEARSKMPQWVADGEATWAQATIVPSATDIIASKWTSYLFYPKTPFYSRGYDAVGVFGHAGDLNGPSQVWTRMMSVATLSTQQPSDAVLKAEIAGFSDRYFSSWGASYFRDTRSPWQINGPGLAMSGRPEPDKITLGEGELKVLAAGQYEATQTSIETPEDILEVALVQGYGRVHDASFAIDTALDTGAPLSLCVRPGGCTCPPDSEGKVPDTQKASTPISIGLDGGDDAIARVGLATRSLDEFCKRKKRKPAPDPGGGGSGGGGGGDDADPMRNPQNGHSVGDPHLRTFDGVPFDFQHVGEYTLSKSTKDDFVVQVRQIPVQQSRAVAINQAMATKIGGRRVTIALENGAVVFRVDGVVLAGDPPAVKDGSIARSISGYGTKYTLEWPDGTIVTAGQISHFALNVAVKPSAARKGALEGLFGNDDGTPGNDDVDGASLASKWLVPASASLFDYGPGQSADTFVDPNFPDPTETVPNRDAAEKACREEGITDQTLLHNCIVDFGVTNGFLFADQYAQQQAVLTARFATMTAATPPVPAMRVVKLAGSITDAAHPPQVTFAAAAGDVIDLARPDCNDVIADRKVFVIVVDPNGKNLRGGNACDVGRVDLPVAGSYTVRVVKPPTGDGLDILIRFVRHDRVGSIKYGDIVSGNIEQHGAHDRFMFTANAGDVIQIHGPGCDLGGMFISFIDPAGHDTLGPICREGFANKIQQSGTYTLLVNSGDGGPGAYHFVFQGVAAGGKQ